MDSKKRCGSISQDQKSSLINFLNRNPKLLSGKFSSEFTFKCAQKLWETITEELNSIPGAKKDWRHWRKTWQDIRTATKLKSSIRSKEINKTGGGQCDGDIEISELDSQVLNLIKPVATSGHKDIAESKVIFKFDESCDPNEIQSIPECSTDSVYLPEACPNANSPISPSQDSLPNIPTSNGGTNIFKTGKSKKLLHRASDAAPVLAYTAKEKLLQKEKIQRENWNI